MVCRPVPARTCIVRALSARPALRRACLGLIVAVVQGTGAGAQEIRPAGPAASAVRFEIESITIEGNSVVSLNDIRTQLLTRETPGWMVKFLHHTISERLGRKDEFYDPTTFSGDIDRIKRHYLNRGFNGAAIDTQLVFNIDQQSVEIRIGITEGRQALIDTVEYRGVLPLPPVIIEDLHSSPRIQGGEPYNRMLLEDEVKRVLTILKNNGYPNAEYVRDSSAAFSYASSGNYRVLLTFRMGSRYRFGKVAVVQEVDSLRGGRRRDDITDELIFDHLDYTPGEVYGAHKIAESQSNLNRLGILDLRSISENVPSPRETTSTVSTVITYLPRDRNELAPELIVSDENGALNLGAGLGFTQRNFFGGARTANARLRFRTQSIGAFPRYFEKSSDVVSTLDMTFDLQQPYVFSNKLHGSWTFSGIMDKQKPYFQYILRNRFGFSGKFAEFTSGFLDWTLEFVDLSLKEVYEQSTDPEIVRQVQRVRGQESQFNSILGFTIQRDKANDLFSPSAGFIHSFTVEEAGFLPLVLRRAFPRIPFTQFYRVNAIGRWYLDLTDHRFSILAFKAKAGLEGKYGESFSNSKRQIPQTHLFFGGGSGSVRGWQSRGLIAGGDPLLGGNMVLEGSVELRVNVLQSMRDGLLDKFWVVGFLDAGNVWVEASNFSISKIALAAGIGIRYDTFFGPFRIDWGFRVYNPAEVPGEQWIVDRKLVGQTFKEGVFHFGIGHAF
jgi:outer membrane protein insertion porin family